MPLRDGETLVAGGSGGGGFGSPLMRPPGEVAHDARERWISVDAARSVFGVVIGPDGGADEAASEKLRAEMAVR